MEDPLASSAFEMFRMPLSVPDCNVLSFDWIMADFADEILCQKVILLTVWLIVNWEEFRGYYLFADLIRNVKIREGEFEKRGKERGWRKRKKEERKERRKKKEERKRKSGKVGKRKSGKSDT